MEKRQSIDVMIDAHVWMRRQAAKHGEWDMPKLAQLRAHIAKKVKRFGFVVEVSEIHDATGERVEAKILTTRRDPAAWVSESIPLREFAAGGLGTFDRLLKASQVMRGSGPLYSIRAPALLDKNRTTSRAGRALSSAPWKTPTSKRRPSRKSMTSTTSRPNARHATTARGSR
jgi:hypothetical protein